MTCFVRFLKVTSMLFALSLTLLTQANADTLRILNCDELKAVRGGSQCDNTSAKPINNEGKKTKDPVTLNSGNLSMDAIDIQISSNGPDLTVSRVYNSHVYSIVDGWQPETGAGPWTLEDNAYTGHGDRTLSESEWPDFTLTLDMKTTQPGPECARHVPRINFRYGEHSRAYYVLID